MAERRTTAIVGRGLRVGLCLSAAALSGCASVALRSYVGKPVDAIVERYGPPFDQRVVLSGLHEFRWTFSASRKPGAAAPLDMFLPVSTAPLQRRKVASASGLLLGGMCVYSVTARWDPVARIWRVISYRTPRIDCN